MSFWLPEDRIRHAIRPAWYGIVAPAGLKPEVTAKLSDAIRRTLASADVQDKLAQFGSGDVSTMPEQFGAFIRAEAGKWGKAVKASGGRRSTDHAQAGRDLVQSDCTNQLRRLAAGETSRMQAVASENYTGPSGTPAARRCSA